MSDPSWLIEYYKRLQGDYQSSFVRRDNVTNRTYTLLLAFLAVYFGFFSANLLAQPLWRYSFVVGILVIMIRFFFQSMIIYGFILRYRYLKMRIESHWLEDGPTVDEIKKDMLRYDHGGIFPPTGRSRLWDGQIRSGFILNLIIPLILIANELNLVSGATPNIYLWIMIFLIIYVITEVINFITFDRVKKS